MSRKIEFSAAQVQDIKARLAAGESQQAIARHYGCAQGTISKACGTNKSRVVRHRFPRPTQALVKPCLRCDQPTPGPNRICAECKALEKDRGSLGSDWWGPAI